MIPQSNHGMGALAANTYLPTRASSRQSKKIKRDTSPQLADSERPTPSSEGLNP
jgi:hypothetical protein